MNNFKNKVAVGLSGGVDSSVAAMILQEQGYDVIGVTMEIFSGDASTYKVKQNACYGPDEKEDIELAEKLCHKLGIEHYVIDLRKEYQKNVLDYFTSEYAEGRTPNPCVKCNWKMKFGAMVDELRKQIEIDYFATGHYARIEKDENTNRYLLKKAKDLVKDQTYFLYNLSQKQLSRTLFPLGNLEKRQVKQMAAKLELDLEHKKESQNFISGGHDSLLKAGANKGSIKDKHGKIIGEHRGIQLYTIGQRKGLGISSVEPLYVTKIIKKENVIVVGSKADLLHNHCQANHLNWIFSKELKETFTATAKIRYVQDEHEANIVPLGEDLIGVDFYSPQMAITPGQSIVFYKKDVCLGGGIIV